MDKHELEETIEDLHLKYSALTEGQVATSIPELGKANPEGFGVSLTFGHARVAGHVGVEAERRCLQRHQPADPSIAGKKSAATAESLVCTR
jgi:hypothetical protein